MQDEKHVILCIDDDQDVRLMMQTVLEANNYVVKLASSAEEGIKTAKDVNPDLIIVDLMMEEVDAGTNFVKEMQRLDNEAPIYMLSSVGDNLTLATDYTDLGLAGVFQKPLDNDRLLKVIKEKLGE